MARRMPKRDSKGRFVKRGKTTTRRKRSSKKNPPAPARRRRAPARKRRAPARRRSTAVRNPRTGRYVSRKNPAGDMSEALIAGVVVGGLDLLAGMFLAPRWPTVTMWGKPIAKGIGGWYLREKTKMRDAGTVLLGSAAAELTVLAVGWATGALAGPAPPPNGNGTEESAAWFRMRGNFPRPQLSHPMSTPGKLGYYAASRRVTDPLPTSGIPNMATSL